MPDFGNPVADQITAPNPNQSIQTLSGLLDVARQRQALQSGQQQLQVGQAQAQQAQQEMAERQLLQQTMATGKDPDGNPIKNPDGSINPTAFTGFVNTHMPLTGQDVVQKVVKTQSDQLGVQKAALGLTGDERNLISNVFQSAAASDNPGDTTASGLAQLSSMSPQMAAFVKAQEPLIPHLQAMNPAQQKQALITAAQQYAPPEATRTATAPAIGTVTGPGGGVQPVQTNPLSPVPMGPVGSEIAQGISPVEAAQRVPVFQNGQPGTVPLGSITPGAPGYTGNNAFGTGRYGSQPGTNPGFAPSGAPIGTGNDVDWMKKDYQTVQADAASAAQRIGLYNNVQQLSKQALTGPQDRLSYANSLLALVGVPKAENLNDAAVALNKNASMIQQAFGGNTDAARAVVAHFTPGTVMPDKVNQEISDYGKAYGQMQQFAQKYLQQPSNGTDPAAYKTAKANLSLIADPRIWEFQNKAPDDRVDMLRTMTPQQRAQFGELYKRAAAIGAFQ